MATLSNQGRTVPELPTITSGNIGNSDFLIIQNVASNSTKKSTITDFSQKSANIITKLNNLNFTGPNNSFTGSIRNVDDTYSYITQGVPNVLKRLIVSDYLAIGYNPTVATQLDIYSKIITVDQSIGVGISFIGNGSNGSIDIINYPGGINLASTPFSGEQITASYSPYGFSGNLKGNLRGDVNSTGTSNFETVNINTELLAASAILPNVTVSGGTINDTTIGSSTPSTIIGTVITAVSSFVGTLNGNVNATNITSNDVTTTTLGATTVTSTNVVANNISGKLTGNLTGSIRGDVYSNNGTKVLENGAGGVSTAIFYGTSSYSRNGLEFSSFSSSYAFSSSHALTSSFAGTSNYSLNCGVVNADTADFLNWNGVTSNGTASYAYFGVGKYSSFSSSYAFRSTSAISSSHGVRSLSASYALRALTVAGTVDQATYAINAGNADSALTSSYVLQSNVNKSYSVPYYDGTQLSSGPGLYFDPYTGGYKILKLSSSMALSYFQVFSRGYTSGGVKYNQSGLSLYNLNSNEVYPNIDGWNLVSTTSGSLVLSAPIGSYEFSSSNVVAKSNTGEVYGLIQKRNGFYFWPYMGSNSPARDGAIGIGVQPPSEPTGSFNKYLRAKLHINCYSGSGEGPWSPKATVENRAVAILVQYGSGSINTSPYTTFYVSASGNTYCRGTLTADRKATLSGSFSGSFLGGSKGFRTLNNKNISFWGTGSHAVSSSFAQKSKLAESATNADNATFATTAGSVATYYGVNANYSFSMMQPAGAITYGNYLFYTQYNNAGRFVLYRLDQTNGRVIKVYKDPTYQLNGGRMSIHKFNYTPTDASPEEDGVQDRLIYGYNGGIVVVSRLTNIPIVRVLVTPARNFYGMRCVYVDVSATSPAAGSPTYPNFYMWESRYDSSNDYNNMTSFWKIFYNGVNWTTTQLSTAPNFNSDLAIDNIVNYNEWLSVESSFPSFRIDINSINYNPVSKRLYVIGNGSGLCNIFTLNYINDNIGEWYALTNSPTKYNYLTYNYSVVVPAGDAYYNSEYSDYGALEYDTTTGSEKFWCNTRYGTGGEYPGSIIKSRFWGV